MCYIKPANVWSINWDHLIESNTYENTNERPTTTHISRISHAVAMRNLLGLFRRISRRCPLLRTSIKEPTLLILSTSQPYRPLLLGNRLLLRLRLDGRVRVAHHTDEQIHEHDLSHTPRVRHKRPMTPRKRLPAESHNHSE